MNIATGCVFTAGVVSLFVGAYLAGEWLPWAPVEIHASLKLLGILLVCFAIMCMFMSLDRTEE